MPITTLFGVPLNRALCTTTERALAVDLSFHIRLCVPAIAAICASRRRPKTLHFSCVSSANAPITPIAVL